MDNYINYWIINEWYIEKKVAETDRGIFKSTFRSLLGSEKNLKPFSERSTGRYFKNGIPRKGRSNDVGRTSKFLT
jgi:hypothetical protein